MPVAKLRHLWPLLLAFWTADALGQRVAGIDDRIAISPDLATRLHAINTIASGPDDRIDVLAAKFAIDRLVSPTFDERLARRQLDALHAAVVKRRPSGATNDQTLELLIDTLYKPGPWNDHRAFRYDFDDPYGDTPTNKLLSHYLRARKGNCVTMPLLLVVLGHRLGLPITLATAPQHVLAKYRSDAGRWVNIEATSGGYKLDASYQKELEITPAAVAQGTYLRALTRRESISVLYDIATSHRRRTGNFDEMLAIATSSLQLHPDNVTSLLSRHGALAHKLNAMRARYARPADVPPQEWTQFVAWSREYEQLETRARNLGWVPASAEMEARYKRMIQGAREGG